VSPVLRRPPIVAMVHRHPHGHHRGGGAARSARGPVSEHRASTDPGEDELHGSGLPSPSSNRSQLRSNSRCPASKTCSTCSRPTPMMERSSCRSPSTSTATSTSISEHAEQGAQSATLPARRRRDLRALLPDSPPVFRCSGSRSIRQSKSYDPLFISNYGTINLTRRALPRTGVGQIANSGPRTMRCASGSGPDKLAKLGLTVSDLCECDPGAEQR